MNISLGEMESRFADIIRENEGISSGELVKICADKFNWKKSTTYTMLRRLCDKGICENKDGHVSAIISKEKIAAIKTDKLIEEDFGGSLPRFLAAFADRKKLSESDIDEIQQLIDSFRKG
jgi:predicted transcriptional regulator